MDYNKKDALMAIYDNLIDLMLKENELIDDSRKALAVENDRMCSILEELQMNAALPMPPPDSFMNDDQSFDSVDICRTLETVRLEMSQRKETYAQHSAKVVDIAKHNHLETSGVDKYTLMPNNGVKAAIEEICDKTAATLLEIQSDRKLDLEEHDLLKEQHSAVQSNRATLQLLENKRQKSTALENLSIDMKQLEAEIAKLQSKLPKSN